MNVRCACPGCRFLTLRDEMSHCSQQGELTPAALESYTLCMRQRLRDVLAQYTAKFQSLKERQLRSATTDREQRVAEGRVRWKATEGNYRLVPWRVADCPNRLFTSAAARHGPHHPKRCSHVCLLDIP